MKLFDIFKKKKRVEKPKVEKKVERIKKVKKAPEVRVAEKPKVFKPRAKHLGLAYQVLKSPHISEKATNLVEKNQYTFKIFPRTNKVEIKKAVEDLYGVDVLSVKVIKIPKKRKRLGKITGWKQGYKKAIVKVKKGQKIEVLPR